MAGRPKLDITVEILEEIEDKLNLTNWEDKLLRLEESLLQILRENDYRDIYKFDFKIFIENNLALIKKCRYIQNNRIKNYQTLNKLISIDKNQRTDEENKLLELSANISNLNQNQYYNYYMHLNNYRSLYNQKLKEIQNLNQAKNNENEDAKTKNNERKKLNHQKFFLGGAFLSLNEYLNPTQDKSPDEALIEMTKIYITLGVLNRTDEFLAEFDKNQHLPIFDEISRKLSEVQNDIRSPFRNNE